MDSLWEHYEIVDSLFPRLETFADILMNNYAVREEFAATFAARYQLGYVAFERGLSHGFGVYLVRPWNMESLTYFSSWEMDSLN